MEEEANVRMIVELLDYEIREREEFRNIIARNPFVPSYVLTQDFFEKIEFIRHWKYFIIQSRWRSYFDDCWKQMLSSHKMYLTFVMYACLREQSYHQNIFDCFISVCLLVNFLNQDTFDKTRVSYHNSWSDVFLVYYEMMLKLHFNKHGGFQKLVEFIRCRRRRDEPLSLDINTSGEFMKEILMLGVERINPETVSNDRTSIILANTVLAISTIELPSLPSYTDLVMALVAHRKNEAKLMNILSSAFNEDSVLKADRVKSNREKKTLFFPEKTDPVSKKLDLSKNIMVIRNPDIQNLLNGMQTPRAAIAIRSDEISPSTTSVKTSSLPNELDSTARQVASVRLNGTQTHVDANAFDSDKTPLLNTSDRIPSLANKHDPKGKKAALKEISQTAGKDKGIKTSLTSETSKAASHGSSSSISNSEYNYDPRHQENLEQCENIIQAVMRYNHAKSLSDENSNNQIQMDKEAGRVLERLKDSIKSLIEVLDKYDDK